MEYTVRVPTDEEWERLVEITGGEDSRIHWKNMYFWTMGEKDGPFRTIRGFDSALTCHEYDGCHRALCVGFRPAFAPKEDDGLPEGTEIIAPTLFRIGLPVEIPPVPFAAEDIAVFFPGNKIHFGKPSEDPTYQIHAIKVCGVYIADRCVLRNISWRDLARNGIIHQEAPKASMPTLADYKSALEYNAIRNWKGEYSWLADEPGLRAGFLDQDFVAEGASDVRDPRIGFRPVFDRTLFPGASMPIATLFIDGKPVKIPQNPVYDGDIPMFVPGSKIEFWEPLGDPAYQIKAIALEDKLIADRCVLQGVSWDDLKSLGF